MAAACRTRTRDLDFDQFMSMFSRRTREYVSDCSLLVVSIIWGSTFIIIKQSIAEMPPFAFLTLRFFTAAVILAAVCYKRFALIDKTILRDGIILGSVLFLIFATQTVGLITTPAAVTGFITGLYVIFVPMFSSFALRKYPETPTLAGVLLSCVGLGLITLSDKLSLSQGEFLVLLCALFISVHIILTDYYSKRHDIYLLTTIQIVCVLTLSFAWSVLFEPAVLPEKWNFGLGASIILTGVLATALAFFVMTGVQKHTTPTKAAIIYTMEPVSSAFFSYFIGNELLATRQYIGAFLIICGMLFAEIGTAVRKNP